MTHTPDLAALKAEAEQLESEWKVANAAKLIAMEEAKKSWALAAAAHTRYKRAEEKMERTQMRARGVVEADNEPA